MTEVKETKYKFSVLLINDNSSLENNDQLNQNHFFKEVRIINLKKNVGSQKAIATGLKYISELSTLGLGEKQDDFTSHIFFISNFQLDNIEILPYFDELNSDIIRSATSFWNIKIKQSNQKLLFKPIIHLVKISVEIL